MVGGIIILTEGVEMNRTYFVTNTLSS